MTLYGYKVPKMASLLVWVVIWEIVGRLELVMLFPPFTEVLAALGDVVTSASFAEAMRITVYSYVMGLSLAIVVGIAMGFLMGLVPAVDGLLNMWVNIFLSAPLSALVPIFMILFGMGTPTVIVTVFMFSVFIIALDTRAGVRHVSGSLMEMAHSFGASRFERLKIVFLAALPEILSGVRLGVIRGVKGVVIGQLLVSIIGVGALFTLYSNNFLMAHFWALILILFTLALTLAGLVARLETRIEYYAGARS
ncbi:ABC transporter permease [Aurantimonas endophytica]|jgi:NitT/TauT family transport system permease protein|uniref:NitT/TauT family transport system permease protein n=1 Tax=Aurantimonas endophytica TaxID=1522175 RepID=A0A7W6MNL2_9HYPH|nr:ABC transporter permease subunit [Aurantimonas endophytica]MBB4001985.1 NitT/TauT family transport system permease protein [Aurantimonas endophytica]MCO6402382.1 ABC transporter permease subunit [Aurantimonas endophytica]